MSRLLRGRYFVLVVFLIIGLSVSVNLIFHTIWAPRAGEKVASIEPSGWYAREEFVTIRRPDPIELALTGRSPNTASHQGVARDKEHYYTFDTDAIYKFNLQWQKVKSAKDINRSLKLGTNHLGDGEEYDGKIYLPIEVYRKCSNFSNQNIVMFDSQTLKYVNHFDISKQKAEISSLTIDPHGGRNGIIYTTSFCDGSKIWAYDLLSGVLLGTIELSQKIPHIQGIAVKDGYFYITEDVKDIVWLVSGDGRVLRQLIHYPSRNLEGVDFTGDTLLLTSDQGQQKIISTWRPRIND